MDGEKELKELREKEYKVLNSLSKNYKMPVDSLGEYVETLDRIRLLNKKIGGQY